MLHACKSPSHRAALRLLGVVLGGTVDDDVLRDVQNADPVALAEIANAHHLHTVLFSATQRDTRILSCCPADFWLYLEAMQKANAIRNDRGRAQLRQIRDHFARAEIQAVVLKGGAGLLDPLSEPSWRFVSDLDLLIDPDRGEDARTVLAGLGGHWQSFTPVTAQRMHHLPSIAVPDWEFPVELHIRVGQPKVSKVLSPAVVAQSSIATDLTCLRIPSLSHRYLHHVLHTAHGRHDGDAVYLRAILDHHAFLTRMSDAERAAAQLILERHGLAHHARRLDAITMLLSRSDETAIGLRERIWLRSALRGFGRPLTKTTRVILGSLFGYAFRFVSSQAYRRHYLEVVRSREDRLRVITLYRDRIGRIR
jgi:hypothetical protein